MKMQKKIKTEIGHLYWDQNEPISKKNLSAKNLVRLSLQVFVSCGDNTI